MSYPIKKLGEVLEYEQPSLYIVSSKNYKDDYETPVLTAGKSFILGKTKEKNGIFPKDKLPVIIFDDFTTATKFVDFPFKVKSSAMKILHPVKNISDAKFLFYLIQNISFDHTGIHKRYWISEYSKIEILLPPLPEQHRIVKILDEVFADVAKAKENTEKNLQNAKELFESYLQSVFAPPSLPPSHKATAGQRKLRTGKESSGKDWEEKRLGDVIQKSETINPLNNPNKEFTYIDVSSVNKESLTIENTSLIKGKNAPSRARKLVRTGDVIFATVRPTLRRIAIIPKEFNEQICSTGYIVLRSMAELDNKLVFYFIQTKAFNEQMEKLQKGASYPAVTDAEVRNQIILFPKSLSEQKSIVAKLDALSAETRKLEVIYKQKLADLEELKKSALKKAFSGEL